MNKQIINHNLIKSLNPCESRYENFANEYPDFEGNLEQFLSLDNITYDDKIWVSVRLLSKKQRIRFALLCAESVLHIYEAYNNDGILRRVLTDYMNDIGNEELRFELKQAAYAANAAAYAAAAYTAANAAYAANAANAADAAAAAYAANAAAYAAADAANAAAANAAYAAYAADAAAAAYAADAAAYAADAAAAAYAANAADARQKQEELNLLFLYEVFNHG